MNATYIAYLIFAAAVTVLSFETQDVYYDDYKQELKPRLVVAGAGCGLLAWRSKCYFEGHHDHRWLEL